MLRTQHGSVTVLKQWLIKSVASGLFFGYAPIVPATFGTLVAIPIYYSTSGFGIWLKLALWTGFLVASIPISGAAEKIYGKKDPRNVVLDEIVGFLFIGLFFPWSIENAIIMFFLFRVFDVIKPPPARWAEGLPGGWGIVLDDVIAGMYAALTMLILGRVLS